MGGGNVERARMTDDVWTLGAEIVFDANWRDGRGGRSERKCGDSISKR